MLEIVAAITEVWGADRVGIRLSPFNGANDSGEPEPLPLYRHVIGALAPLGLAYLHLVEARGYGPVVPGGALSIEPLRPHWPGPVIVAGGFDAASGPAAVAAGQTDAVAYGRLFISNPDLPDRLRLEAPLQPYDRTTFYGGGAAGYTDYAALGQPGIERVS